MKKNYKLQNTNYKQITNYKSNGIHASMQTCSHADIKGFGKSTPYYLLLTTLAAGGKYD
jgi:hypothetical protein